MSTPDHAIALEIAQFAQRLYSADTLEDLVETALQDIPRLIGHREVSVVLAAKGGLHLAGSSNQSMTKATQLELDLSEGPAIEIMRDDHDVVRADLYQSDSWPIWRPLAIELGWRSWMSVRLPGRNSHPVGVLELAASTRDSTDDNIDDKERAQLLATHLGTAIDTAQLDEHLHIAKEAQMHVGQAIGILMERYQITADQAFSVLRRYSQDQNIKLRDVASEVIEHRRLPTDLT